MVIRPVDQKLKPKNRKKDTKKNPSLHSTVHSILEQWGVWGAWPPESPPQAPKILEVLEYPPFQNQGLEKSNNTPLQKPDFDFEGGYS